jgi:MFS family permease
VPFLLIQIHGYSALAVGGIFLPFVTIAFVLGRLSGRIVARFGVRLPLIVASLALAAGFLLFALPGANHHGSYWTTFFPAMVVQGFGMALVIAPLTTVALNSVKGPHTGLASGVNNAVCRAGGLLAVAVLGAVISAGFSAHLDARLEEMKLSAEVREAVVAEKVKLGAAGAPESVDAATAARIEEAVAESFVAGFRLIMVVGVGLALASALVALVISPQHPTPASP